MADDWDKVTVIGKRAHTSKQLKSEGAINAASRSGGTIISEKKTGLNSNMKTTEGSKIAKADRDTDEGVFEVVKVSASVSKAIQDGRRLKEWTQKDLATKINEKPQIVNEYESGKGTPNQQVLAKMERALGIKLRGKDIGQPLPARGPKAKGNGDKFHNKLVIIGDDTAAGVGDNRDFTTAIGIAKYIGRRMTSMNKIRQNWNLYNYGVPNSSSRDWLPTSEKKTDQGVTHFERVFCEGGALDTKIVIVLLGFNDGRCNPPVSASDTLDHIASITKVLGNMGKKVIVCPFPNMNDHLVNDTLYGENIDRNSFITNFSDNSERSYLISGPLCIRSNYEYRGEFLLHSDKQHFGTKGYDKLGRDLVDILEHEMVKIEFQSFRQYIK